MFSLSLTGSPRYDVGIKWFDSNCFWEWGLPSSPPIPSCTIVLTKWFLYDAKCGELGEVAFVGLIQSLVEGASSYMIAMYSTLSTNLAGSASDKAAL